MNYRPTIADLHAAASCLLTRRAVQRVRIPGGDVVADLVLDLAIALHPERIEHLTRVRADIAVRRAAAAMGGVP